MPTTFCSQLVLPDSDQLKTAIATIRKLPTFGMKAAKVDFEWPTEKDLLAMPKGKPIKVAKLKWKRAKAQEQSFGAF